MKNIIRKNVFIFLLILSFLILVGVISYMQFRKEELWSIDTISIIGSYASVIGFVIVIRQLFEIETKTEAIKATYESVIYQLFHSEILEKISTARQHLSEVKKKFEEDKIIEARENLDFVYSLLSELDLLSLQTQFYEKIEQEKVIKYIGFCLNLLGKIYAFENEGLHRDQLGNDYKTIFEVERFLTEVSLRLKIKDSDYGG